MEWLNYHHLLYFWTVAKEGGVGQAAKVLHLSQPTISGQIKVLEESLEVKLFQKVGRKLELTDDGHMVYRYAEDIFGLGKELMNAVRGRPSGRPLRLHVGISDALPKLVCHDLLVPAMRLEQQVQVICHGDKTDRLLASLAIKGLDLVLADEPVGSQVKVKAYNHLLGESGLTFFGVPDLARAHRRGFPHSLNGAPLLLPTGDQVVRRALDKWFGDLGIHPNVVAEFDDTGLLKSFGQGGEGLFISPTVVEAEVKKQYGVHVAGRTVEVTEKVYAITVERRLKHPAAMAISEAAKNSFFVGKGALG